MRGETSLLPEGMGEKQGKKSGTVSGGAMHSGKKT